MMDGHICCQSILLFCARGTQTLLLDHNRLDSVPLAICQLPQLEALVLSCNAITQLPGAISQLTALSQLKLNQNHLSQLPPALGRCRSLRQVDVSSNQLTVIVVCTIAIRTRVTSDMHNIASLQYNA